MRSSHWAPQSSSAMSLTSGEQSTCWRRKAAARQRQSPYIVGLESSRLVGEKLAGGDAPPACKAETAAVHAQRTVQPSAAPLAPEAAGAGALLGHASAAAAAGVGSPEGASSCTGQTTQPVAASVGRKPQTPRSGAGRAPIRIQPAPCRHPCNASGPNPAALASPPPTN